MIDCKLKISLRARNLLTEEHPLSNEYIIKLNDNFYLLQAKFAGMEGISRFILGLYDEIKILEPLELKQYIQKKIENMAKIKTPSQGEEVEI